MAAADCSNHTKREDATIRRALRILEARMREPGDKLDAPAAARDYLALRMGDREHEIFAVVFLDAQNRVIAAEELFRGTLTQTSVYPREIVKRALALNAAGVILAHNHPSGVAEPSLADRLLTDQLRTALGLVGVQVTDHFIIAGSRAYSFAECGYLSFPADAAPALAPPKPTSRRGRPRKVQGEKAAA
jgi:DNA repair protein RadC